MTRGFFERQFGLMEEVLRPQEAAVHALIPLKMQFAIVLYKLACCAEYHVIANQFTVHKSTVKKFSFSFFSGQLLQGDCVFRDTKSYQGAQRGRSLRHRTVFSRSSAYHRSSMDHTFPFCHQVMYISDVYKVLQAVVVDSYR